MYKIKLRKVPKHLQPYARELTKFVVDKLFHHKTKSVLEEIEITFAVKFAGDEADHIARCDPLIDEHAKPRRFRIEFNPLQANISTRDFLVTLAHELVHAWQYASGRLQHKHHEVLGVYALWEGKFVDEHNIGYWFLPWELEAQGYEVSLYSTFVDRHPELRIFTPTTLAQPGETERLAAAREQVKNGIEINKLQFLLNQQLTAPLQDQ